MQYMLLIYDDEKGFATLSEEAVAEVMRQYRSFADDLRKTGQFRAGSQLAPTRSATSVRKSAAGKLMTTDGPFAETKEQIGGYFIIECTNLEEAIAIAGRIPSLRPGGGVIEVRALLPPSA